MYNLLILGSGRSGTSLVAGTLAQAGYHMGNDYIQARESNPKGFFEDEEVNTINELLLRQVLPKRPKYVGRFLFRDRLGFNQQWLARLPLGTEIPTPDDLVPRMQQLTGRSPYCYKDPRFSYTLANWRPSLKPDTRFICIFREPADTARSILKECKRGYLRHVSMDFDRAIEIWTLMHRHIVEKHRHEGQWLFLHFNQVLEVSGLDRIAAFTGASVNRTFPDPALRRSTSVHPVPSEVTQIYNELCELAEYQTH